MEQANKLKARKKIIYIIIYVFFFSCDPQKSSTSIDKSKITILKTEKSINLNNEDFLLAENLVKQRLAIYNTEENASNIVRDYALRDSLHKGKIIELDKYYKQCEAVLNEKGEKIIHFNCMCNPNSNWETQKIIVKDGGNCYFQISVNLDKKIVFGFLINGNA